MPQLNGASQVRYFSSSARKDVGQWIKVMVTIINNKVMVGKRWGCILSEREREREILQAIGMKIKMAEMIWFLFLIKHFNQNQKYLSNIIEALVGIGKIGGLTISKRSFCLELYHYGSIQQ